MLPLTRRGVRAWVNADATLFVAAVRTGRRRWQATNLCARHPGSGERSNGEHRSDPFIADIVAQADELGVTINATAGDMKLYDDIYSHHGFTIRKPGQRPKITRAPRQDL